MKKITFFLIFCSITIFGQVKLTSNLEESFNGTNWSNSSKTSYEYDSNANLILETFQRWNSSWNNSYTISYTYNANNKVVEKVEKVWNNSTGLYDNLYKDVYTYNSNGDITTNIFYNWNVNKWEQAYKTELEYNADNKVYLGDSFEWNGSTWVKELRTTLSYTIDEHIDFTTYSEWNGTEWNVSGKQVYSYNDVNRLVKRTLQALNGVIWTDIEKIEYEYDLSGNITRDKFSEIDNGSWVVFGDDNFIFDTTKAMSNFIHPFKDKTGSDYLFEPLGITNKIMSFTSEDNTRVTYNYDEATASIKDISLLEFNVYPNPVEYVLTIENNNFSIKNIEIYNILGAKIVSTSKNRINTENFVKGVYLLKIYTKNGNSVSKKIIKS